jgi:hypothetical protein
MPLHRILYPTLFPVSNPVFADLVEHCPTILVVVFHFSLYLMSAPAISCPMGLIIVELWSNYLEKLRKPVKTFGPVPSGFVPFCQSVRSRELRMWRKPTVKVYQDILFITFSTRPHLYWKPWKSPKRLGRFTTIGQRKVSRQVHTMWDSKQADVHKGGNCTEKAYTSFKTRFPQLYRCDVLRNRKKV